MKYSAWISPEPGEIHLWLINLEDWSDRSETLLEFLSDDERARASRLIVPKVRNRFIVARGLLRKILAGSISVSPEELQFAYGEHGKPELLNNARTDTFFNLSHSAEMALLAINRRYQIGVDIEKNRLDRHFLKLSDRFFSHRESGDLASLPEDEIPDGFYSCWTRKEAYLKAIGTGLATPLNAFDVTLKPDEQPALYGQRLDPAETGRWKLLDITVPAGYRAAVATMWQSPEIIIRNWQPNVYPFLS